MRQTNSVKEAMGMHLQEVSRVLRTGRCGQHSFIELDGTQYKYYAHNILFKASLEATWGEGKI